MVGISILRLGSPLFILQPLKRPYATRRTTDSVNKGSANFKYQLTQNLLKIRAASAKYYKSLCKNIAGRKLQAGPARPLAVARRMSSTCED